MRLYSLVGADSHVTPDGTRHTPDEAGGFDFPDDDAAEEIASFAVKGKKLWETEGERVERLHGMEMARRRDPASMLAALEDNAALNRKVTELMAMLTAAQLAQAPTPSPKAEAPRPAPAEEPADPEGDADTAASGPKTAPALAKAARTTKAAPKTS